MPGVSFEVDAMESEASDFDNERGVLEEACGSSIASSTSMPDILLLLPSSKRKCTDYLFSTTKILTILIFHLVIEITEY